MTPKQMTLAALAYFAKGGALGANGTHEYSAGENHLVVRDVRGWGLPGDYAATFVLPDDAPTPHVRAGFAPSPAGALELLLSDLPEEK